MAERGETVRKRITKRTVDAMRPAEETWFLRDSDLPGFGVRITPAGVRTYVVEWKRAGRSRRLSIGRHGAPWTPEGARREAMRLKAEVAAGHDPAETRGAERAAPTVAGLADRFLAEHVQPKCRPTTGAEYARLLRAWVLPTLGRRKVGDVTRADVARLHHSMRERPYEGNRALAILGKMFNLAERWGFRPDGSNPCRHVERFREQRRERFLSSAELARLGEVLRRAEREDAATLKPAPFAVEAVRLLLLTGCRRNEVLRLKWEDVDLAAGRIRIPDSKTGPKTIPVSAPAAEVLSRLPRVEGSPYVLPGRSEAGHLTQLRASWVRIREAAGIADVRLHDLRHSFASVAAGGGESLLLIGGLLGHKRPTRTARYAHLADDPQRAAAERIAGRIASHLDAGGAGEVVELARR